MSEPHHRPVLRERPRENRRKLEVAQVVTGCDHIGSLGFREVESKVRREALGVTFDCLIENLGRNAVDQSKIVIQQHLLTPDRQHARLDCQCGQVCRKTYPLDRHWQSQSHSILRRSLNARSTPCSGSRGVPRLAASGAGRSDGGVEI